MINIRASGLGHLTAALATLASFTADATTITPCAAEVGLAAAERLRDACIDVSPATHPPCGVRNACALIDDEIARGCAILGDAEAAKIAACGSAPTSAAAAADVIRRFYRAIDERDYSTAYAMLRADPTKTQSPAAFEAEFAKTRSTHVEIAMSGTIEGAAGSAYVTIPVTVEATLDDGTRQRFVGSYTLRRVEPQHSYPSDTMRWHIFSSDLR